MSVRVRFAPSPTGFLHIGGARTALFNWLFARHMKGQFILRIEDTDEVRSTTESVKAIFDGLRWMGLDWDEGPASETDTEDCQGDYGPYYQIQRAELYKKYISELIAQGRAYPCYCTPEEVQKMRDKALAEKRTPKYDGTCRNLTTAQREARSAVGSSSVRFKSPVEGVTQFNDIIHGPLTFENAQIEDFVIQKTSGIPTYNFACVIDDHEMCISHVIRGDDHMSNTPRQILVYQALGWLMPQFAHLSMIMGSDGTRLSKRHGATSVQEYETAGFLPEAVRNYLALLGWATEDSQQLFKPEKLIEKFSLERCGKSPCTFDPVKLEWMNGEYIRNIQSADLTSRAMPYIQKAGFLEGKEEERHSEIETVVALEQEKFKLLTDVPDRIKIFFTDVEYDAESVEKTLKKPDVIDILKDVIYEFEPINIFNAEFTERACKEAAKKRDVKNGAIYHPVRVSVSGRTQGPSLFHMLEILGKEKVLSRINSTIEKLTQGLL